MRRRLSIVCAALGVLVVAFVYSRRDRAQPTPPSTAAVYERAGANASDASEALSDVAASPAVDAAQVVAGASEREALVPSARPIVLAGTVFDVEPGENGARMPAAGVRVFASLDRADNASTVDAHGAPAPPFVVTDEHGRFRFERRDADELPATIRIWSDGSDTHQGGRAEVQSSDPRAHDVLLERAPIADLTGRTVDLDGAPVPFVHIVFAMNERRWEVDSDELGFFRAEALSLFESVEVRREGYVLIEAPWMRHTGPDGPEQMRIVLAPTGGLRIAVRDERDAPVEGAALAVRPSPFERWGSKRSRSAMRATVEGVTDASGVTSFDGVWASPRLHVEVRMRPSNGDRAVLHAVAHRNGELVFERAVGDQPIVVEAGQVLSLRASIPAVLRVTGRVEDENGEPVPRKSVSLSSLELEDPVWVHARTDDAGRFAFAFASNVRTRRVRLSAAVGDAFMRPGPEVRVAAQFVDLVAGEVQGVVLVLVRTRSISGRVVDAAGNPVTGLVAAFDDEIQNPHARQHYANIAADGSFEVQGLTATTYDLVVQPRDPYADVHVDEVEAGRDDLEVLVASERNARVSIEVALPKGETADIMLLRKRHDRRIPIPDGVPLLPADTRIAEPTGWPADVFLAWFDDGETLTRMHAQPTTWTLNAGAYQLGVVARDASGDSYFPIGTGLVRIEDGEHRVRFELTLAVRVEGRVHAADALDLAVAIAWQDEKLLELDGGHGDLDVVRELGADGYFAFDLVPIGEHELRVGTPDDLRAGRARHREKITVKREGMSLLDVQVGG